MMARFQLVRMLWWAGLAVVLSCHWTSHALTLEGQSPKMGTVCQYERLSMECPLGHVIRIHHALYGRFSLSVCNDKGITEGWDLNCRAANSKEIVAQRCDGRPRCNITMTNDVFGDPCADTDKYGEVKYSCQPASEDGLTPVLPTEIYTIPDHPINNPRPVRGPPLAPVIRDVMALSPTEISVQWTQPESPNPVLSTRVFLRIHGDLHGPEKRYASGTTTGTMTITGLRPDTRYEIAIQSFNKQGNSPMSNAVRVSTPPGPYYTGPGVRQSCVEGEFRCGTGACIPLGKRCDRERDCEDLSDEVDCGCPGGEFECPSGRCIPQWFVCDNLPHCDNGEDEALEECGVPDIVDPSTTTTKSPDLPDDTTPKPSTPTPPPSTPTPPSTTPTTTTSGEEWPDGGDDEDGMPISSYCAGQIRRGVRWPRTRYGRIAEVQCPRGLIGMSTWRCLSEGWETTGPDYTHCVSPWVDHMDRQIHNLLMGPERIDQVAEELTSAMNDQDLNPGDLKFLTGRLLPHLGMVGKELPHSSLPLLRKFQRALMNTSSSLLAKRHRKSWIQLSREERATAATSLMLAVEDSGFHSAALMEPGARDTTVDSNIVLEVAVVDTGRSRSDAVFPRDLRQNPEWSNVSDSITVTSNSMRRAGADGRVSLVFSLYKNMAELVQPSEDLNSSPSQSGEHSNTAIIHDSEAKVKATDMVVNSHIIAASIGSSKRSHQLAEPVRFTLHHLQPSHGAVPVCAFWDVDHRSSDVNFRVGDVNNSSRKGRWSRKDCRMLDTNSSHTTCECDHLTNFAVLMDISGTELTRSAELGLIWITYIGCTISLICLLLSLITFCLFKNLQCDRNTIHKHLVLSLLLAELVFLGGITQVDNKVVCSVIAGVLHFLFLAAFAWMCLEGIQLYVMLVEVFEQEKSRIKWYYLFGYGIPLVIVAVSAGVNHQGYGTETYCWLTTENHFIWSFVGPALAVMLVNTGMLSVAIYIMCRHSNISATVKERSTATKVRAWLKGAVVLMVLLGLTWLLGLLYVNAHMVVMAYCFTVVNSLQGLFIFIFHCLMNDKVQKEYRKFARRTTWLPDCIRVNYGGYTGAPSTTPNASTGSGNYFSRLFGPKHRKQSAISTNSSAKPFLNKYQQRQSDTDNSRDSSTVPSSLNGYIYNPHFKPPTATTPFLLTTNNNGVTKTVLNGKSDNNYETVDGIAGDLSEYIDCSIVDSEMVTEYCRDNMQVSTEEKRYSTSSDDSEVTTLKIHDPMVKDNLSTLSLASSTNNRGEYSMANSIEPVGGAGACGREEKAPLDLQQYIIPMKRRDEQNGDPRSSGSLDLDSNTDPRCSSLNHLTTGPNQATSGVTPQHNSTPNLQFRLGHRMNHSATPVPPPTVPQVDFSSHAAPPSPSQMDYSSHPAPPSTVPELRSPSSTKSSLPDLTLGGLTLDIDDEARRHSSNVDQFSPFRFSTTQC